MILFICLLLTIIIDSEQRCYLTVTVCKMKHWPPHSLLPGNGMRSLSFLFHASIYHQNNIPEAEVELWTSHWINPDHYPKCQTWKCAAFAGAAWAGLAAWAPNFIAEENEANTSKFRVIETLKGNVDQRQGQNQACVGWKLHCRIRHWLSSSVLNHSNLKFRFWIAWATMQ